MRCRLGRERRNYRISHTKSKDFSHRLSLKKFSGHLEIHKFLHNFFLLCNFCSFYSIFSLFIRPLTRGTRTIFNQRIYVFASRRLSWFCCWDSEKEKKFLVSLWEMHLAVWEGEWAKRFFSLLQSHAHIPLCCGDSNLRSKIFVFEFSIGGRFKGMWTLMRFIFWLNFKFD